ncbi:unnamed protein product [Linum trigynum]|uniref:Uncharacterized protein n=1 Tax=Linum trigynum TaxID=586398 RepID=A0AAV2FR87_9ROSI
MKGKDPCFKKNHFSIITNHTPMVTKLHQHHIKNHIHNLGVKTKLDMALERFKSSMNRVEGIETTHPTPIPQPKSLLELEFEEFMAWSEIALHLPPPPKSKSIIELAYERFKFPMECIDISHPNIPLGCFCIKDLNREEKWIKEVETEGKPPNIGGLNSSP